MAAALLVAGCTDDPDVAPREESAVDVASEPTDPPPTAEPPADDDRPRPELTLEELRRAAAADGRIDRAEAIRLARGVPKAKVKDVEATLEGKRWSIVLWEPLGCHQLRTVHAVTGRPGRTAGAGCS